MNLIDLEVIGLTSNEAKIFSILSDFGESDARFLIKKSGFHKKIIYDNLYRLIDKGFVTSILKDNRKVFLIANSIFDAYIKDQEELVNKRKTIALKLKEELKQKKEKLPESKEATLYEGKMAVKAFYTETLGFGDYLVIGAPKQSVEIMGEVFWDNYHIKRKKNKQKIQLILNNSLREWGNKQKNSFMKIKYFDKDFEPKTEIHIQKNIVAIIVWEEKPLVFKMVNESTAESYKKYFEKLWENSKV